MSPPGPCKQFDVDEALGAAVELFRSNGFNGVSTSQLMKAMGIGKKSLYDTFGSKRDLFLTALKHYADQSVAFFQHHLAQNGGGIPGIQCLLEALNQQSQAQKIKGCLLSVNLADFSDDDTDVSSVVEAAINRLVTELGKNIAEEQQRGVIDATLDPITIGRVIMMTQQGLTMLSRIDSGKHHQQVMDAVFDLLGVSATNPS